jgi:TatD DNase family protein
MSSSSSSSSSALSVIDTHAHLEYVLQQRGNTRPLDAFLPDAIEAVVCVFCDAAAVSPSLSCFDMILSHAKVFGAFGCHPRNAYSWTPQFKERVELALQHEKAVAWGECGLDWSHANQQNTREVQIACFRDQVARAVELGWPICVHSRGAADETFAVLTELAPISHPLHIHCFDGDVEEAERLLEHFSRLWIGFTGSLTHANAHGEKLRRVCAKIPLNRIVLETDAPYLKPQETDAKRKKRNAPSTPADVWAVAEAVARIRNVPMEEVVQQANENARQLYRLPTAAISSSSTASTSTSTSSTSALSPAPVLPESDQQSHPAPSRSN